MAAAAVDVNMADNGGDTALHWAARGGNADIARALIEHADFVATNSAPNAGETALHAAATRAAAAA